MTGPGLSHPAPTWLTRLSRIARLYGRAGPATLPAPLACGERTSREQGGGAGGGAHGAGGGACGGRRRGAAGGGARAAGDRPAARRGDGGRLPAHSQRDRPAGRRCWRSRGSATGWRCRWSRRRTGRSRSGTWAPGGATERGPFGVEVPVGGEPARARRAAGAAPRLRRRRGTGSAMAAGSTTGRSPRCASGGEVQALGFAYAAQAGSRRAGQRDRHAAGCDRDGGGDRL